MLYKMDFFKRILGEFGAKFARIDEILRANLGEISFVNLGANFGALCVKNSLFFCANLRKNLGAILDMNLRENLDEISCANLGANFANLAKIRANFRQKRTKKRAKNEL